MESKRLFTNRQIFRLVWPLLLEQLLNVLVGMVDILMVAALGEVAVSGVSLVDAINALMINVLSALTTGGTIVCSQYIGKKTYEKTNEAAGQLTMVTVAMMVFVSLLLLVGRRWILGLIFGQVETAVMDNAYIYCMITALSFPFLALYNSGAAVFRALGDSRTPMKLSILMNVLNIAGNALCIFVLGMGVEGVAIPTLFARAVAAIMIMVSLQKADNGIRFERSTLFTINRSVIGRILTIGIPAGLENGLFSLGRLMLSSLVSTLGTMSIAGYAVASNLVNFLYLPGSALGIGQTAVVGQCVGAEDLEQAKWYSNLFIALNYALLLVVGIPLALGRHYWVGIYHLEAEAARIAASMVLAHTLAMVIWPLAFERPHFFRACNRATYTMKVSVTIMWIFRVGLAYVFVKLCGKSVEWIWYAMFIDWVARVIVHQYNFMKMKSL